MMDCYYFECGKDEHETREKMIKEIESWIMSPELIDIVQAFGGIYPNTKNIKELAAWLLEFSDIWDYRRRQKNAKDVKTGEAARWMVNNDSITEEQEKTVFKGIDRLGLRGVSDPLFNYYDYIIALGGARMSCLFRPRFAKCLLERMDKAPKAVVSLSGMRPVSDTERAATDTYAPDAQTEFDLINAGAEKVFELKHEYMEERYCNPNPNSSWAIRTYSVPKYNFQILSVSGPSSDPETRRANSADTFAFFAEKQHIKTGSRVLLVTSQIYVPYQQLEAIRTWAIPNNVYVETVGFPTEWNTNQQGMMKAANYLQEIRSTIQSVNRYIENIFCKMPKKDREDVCIKHKKM